MGANEVENFLEHYGVKGMQWGVRRSKTSGSESSGEKRSPEEKAARRATAKKVAMGTGILVAAAGTAYVANSMSKNGSLPISSLNRKAPTAETKDLVSKVIESPKNIVYATRGKTKGFSIYDSGGLQEPYSALESAGLMSGRNELRVGNIRKLKDGSVAASMDDPLGRTDSAGRVIPHLMIIPKSMSTGIENIGDVTSKIWPLLADRYAPTYDPKG